MIDSRNHTAVSTSSGSSTERDAKVWWTLDGRKRTRDDNGGDYEEDSRHCSPPMHKKTITFADQAEPVKLQTSHKKTDSKLSSMTEQSEDEIIGREPFMPDRSKNQSVEARLEMIQKARLRLKEGSKGLLQHQQTMLNLGRQRDPEFKQKSLEYVMDDQSEDELIKMEKAIMRQKNLAQLMKDSQVTVVANPYLVAMNGQASIDFVWTDLKSTKKKVIVPSEVIERRRENNMRRLSRIQLSKVLNKNLQTRKTKKYIQSESLQSTELFKSSRMEEIRNQRSGGIES